MKKRLSFLLMTFCLILVGQTGQGVYAQNPKTIEVGPHFGASSYIGELNVWKNLPEWNWKELNQFSYDWGILARYNHNSRWAFRLDYTHGKIRARDAEAAWRPEAKLNFQSKVNDISAVAEFNFQDYYTGHISDVISPYIFAGLSGFWFKTAPYTGNAAVDTICLTDLDTDYYLTGANGNCEPNVKKKYSFSIPFGVGCKMSFTKRLAATVEWRMHYTFTDYLDDVSGVYPDAQNHAVIYDYDLTDPSGMFDKGQQRGNTQTNDWFGFINISFTYKFVIPNRSSCKMNFE